MGNEWITINKDVFDIGRYESLNEFKVFLYFVTHAAEHPTIYKGRALQRGQLALSITDACKRIGISKQSYRTVLRKFTTASPGAPSMSWLYMGTSCKGMTLKVKRSLPILSKALARFLLIEP